MNEEKEIAKINEEQSEDIEEVEEEVLEVEQVWIHPKDRPTVSKEERKANQKLVKEQQVSLNFAKADGFPLCGLNDHRKDAPHF